MTLFENGIGRLYCDICGAAGPAFVSRGDAAERLVRAEAGWKLISVEECPSCQQRQRRLRPAESEEPLFGAAP